MPKLLTHILVTLTALTFAFHPGAVLAVGPIEPTGPQGPVGVTGPVGAGSQTTIEATNSDTGPGSTNNTNIETDQSTTITADNVVVSDTTLEANADTGNNLVGNNLEAGRLETGDVNGTITLVNSANSQISPESSIGNQTLAGDQTGDLLLQPISDRTQITANNLNTGPDSTNENNITNNRDLQVTESNSAEVNNNITVRANTGTNQAINNNLHGDTDTGDINLRLLALTLANVQNPNLILTIDSLVIQGGLFGDLLAIVSNDQTGQGSTNLNSISNNQTNNLNLNQSATLNNNLNFRTNTGENVVTNNGETGDTETGTTEVHLGVTNITDDTPSILYIINVFGRWLGSLAGIDPANVIINEVANRDTGEGSINQNTVTNNTNNDIEINNQAVVNNNMTVDANTGRNLIDSNRRHGHLKTGNIRVAADVVNVVNSVSTTARRISLSFITIFGDWFGNFRAREPELELAELPTDNSVVTVAANQTPSQQNQPTTTTTGGFEPVWPNIPSRLSRSVATSPSVSLAAQSTATGSRVAAVTNPVQRAIFATPALAQNPSLVSAIDTNSSRFSFFGTWTLGSIAVLLVIWLAIELLFAYQDRRWKK